MISANHDVTVPLWIFLIRMQEVNLLRQESSKTDGLQNVIMTKLFLFGLVLW